MCASLVRADASHKLPTCLLSSSLSLSLSLSLSHTHTHTPPHTLPSPEPLPRLRRQCQVLPHLHHVDADVVGHAGPGVLLGIDAETRQAHVLARQLCAGQQQGSDRYHR